MSEPIERDCMSCEQTFTTTAEENAEFCPACETGSQVPQAVAVKPVPAAVPTWKTLAGPIQSKRVREAVQAISWEGRTYVEVSGVIGGAEERTTFTNVFGGNREDCNAAMTAIGERFGWQVTRENYQDIINECHRHLEILRATRPEVDKRQTPEQRAEQQRIIKERMEKEEAYQRERAAKLEEERKQAENVRAAQPVNNSTTDGVTVRYNGQHNGVEISFPGKPSSDVLSNCKAHGFRWSMRGKVWYKKFSTQAWAAAHRITGIPQTDPPKAGCYDPTGAYVQAQEDAQQDAIAQAIGA